MNVEQTTLWRCDRNDGDLLGKSSTCIILFKLYDQYYYLYKDKMNLVILIWMFKCISYFSPNYTSSYDIIFL